MKLFNLTEVEIREINGGTEESYNAGRELARHLGQLMDRISEWWT